MPDKPNDHSCSARTSGRRRNLLVERDLADRWLCSLRTVQRMRKAGYGPAYIRIGGRILYNFEDVLAFELARRQGGEV